MSAFESIRAGYEGMESVFRGDELNTYRASVLDKSRAQAEFVAARATGRMLEVACGNGRLLIALRESGALSSGFGVEIADSRTRFAQAWADDLGYGDLEFETGNALEVAFGTVDAALCITGAFGYFDAYVHGSGPELLTRMRSALRPGGTLVMELYQHPSVVRLIQVSGGVARNWTELPPTDPWRFYLSEVSLDGDVMVHNKTFVHRTQGTVDTGRSERMKIYPPQVVVDMCAAAGFAEVALHEGWTDAPYDRGETLVVVATVPGDIVTSK